MSTTARLLAFVNAQQLTVQCELDLPGSARASTFCAMRLLGTETTGRIARWRWRPPSAL